MEETREKQNGSGTEKNETQKNKMQELLDKIYSAHEKYMQVLNEAWEYDHKFCVLNFICLRIADSSIMNPKVDIVKEELNIVGKGLTL